MRARCKASATFDAGKSDEVQRYPFGFSFAFGTSQILARATTAGVRAAFLRVMRSLNCPGQPLPLVSWRLALAFGCLWQERLGDTAFEAAAIRCPPPRLLLLFEILFGSLL
eukprot:RCo050785